MSTSKINLLAYLKMKNIWFSMLEKSSTMHTSDAAALTGLPLERITKSLVFIADSEPVIVIIPGTCKVDKGKLRAVLNVKRVRIAPFDLAEHYSGYPPGATPPIHHKKINRAVIDQRVMRFSTVYGGGGSRRRLIELKSEDIKRLNNAIVADVVKEAV